MTRRHFLGSSIPSFPLALAAQNRPRPIGFNTYCLRAFRFTDQQSIDFAVQRKLDAIFLQDSLDPRAQDPAHWSEVKTWAADAGLKLETGGGGVYPKTPEAFQPMVDNILRNARRAHALGSPLIRCVIASDRAALQPQSADQVIETMVKLLKAVRQPVMDLGLKVALEVHKDLQAWEFATLIEQAGPDLVGIYLDTGNPVFVMEDPLTTIETLGKYAITVHLRDSVVYETKRGIFVQWVPLGEGTIDFRQVMAHVEQYCPPTAVYIKPITGRPPTLHPVYDPDYWKMYPKARAADLSRFLALARKGEPYARNMVIEDIAGRNNLPQNAEALKQQQREHMDRSIEYGKNTLGLGVKWRG